MTEVEATIWGAILGGGIGLGASYFGYRWNRKVSLESLRISEYNKAAAEFRAAFVDVYHTIQNAKYIGSGDQGYFLMTKIHTDEVDIAHKKAKILCEPYLSATDLEGFSEAWKNYIEWPKHFKDNYDNKDKTSEMLSHLDTLLSYAKPK